MHIYVYNNYIITSYCFLSCKTKRRIYTGRNIEVFATSVGDTGGNGKNLQYDKF
jgi:hypothetical protein